MPRGTGIASYAWNLVDQLRALNHGVDGIFGIDVPADPTLRGAAFLERYRQPSARRKGGAAWERSWRWASRRIRALAPHPLREISGGRKLVEGAADGLPRFDRLFSAGRLFDDALFAFSRTGRFAIVHLPDPPDIMHWTCPLPLRVAGCRNVYTLHDLIPLRLPDATLENTRVYRRLIAGCLRHGTQVCTVSEASKRDIVEMFGVDPSRITNTYQAVADLAANEDQPSRHPEAVEGLFGLERQGYFLHVGAIEPKKNVGRLVEGYLAAQTRTPLVIAGAPAWQSERELHLVPGAGAAGTPGTYRGPLGQMIMLLGHPQRPILRELIRDAKAVVFPSLYEGFGLPVLEAMQLGTPVITSTVSSLPEVAGNATLLVDPYDVPALTIALQRLDGDAALAASLSARGKAQARFFSPERYRDRLTALYAAAMAS